ncbi:ATPase [Halopiger goleimassiliensis]|uniref:ATPase n=1 Tax=Halopiger goleimassiliensis TaxID=1293048 RepID=UPI0006775C0B|nr:ATPase [Halopiger goleimassiliensis]
MNVLVVGADRVDAGKTTFTVGLLARTGGVGYKPRAGNDFWFDHDDCRRALAEGRLYGKDAARIAAAERSDRPPERLNPVHRLWRPSPGGGNGLLGRSDREFLIDRIGSGDPDSTTYVRNATADLPESVAEALPLEDAIPVESVETLNDVAEREYVPAFERIADEIAAADVAVVESYGDIAIPIRSLEPTVVAAVEPRRVRIYPGDRYARACDVASSSPMDGRLEKRTDDVLELLDPLERVELPALPSEERSDPESVATAYEPAYDTVLAAADRAADG